MSRGTAKLVGHSVGLLVRLVFVGGILEAIGMMFYLQWAHPGAVETLTAGGPSVGFGFGDGDGDGGFGGDGGGGGGE